MTNSVRHLNPLPFRISRRQFLRGSGVALAVPLFNSPRQAARAGRNRRSPQRLIAISNNLGVLPGLFFPETTGPDYELSPYLQELQAFRSRFTVFSGLSHPAVEGGHSTENCFLTGARNPTSSGFRNTISLDQFAAERLGRQTRFPTLNLGVNLDRANRSLSWTRDGILLPASDSAADLFRRMFIQGTESEVARRLHELRRRGSILDAVAESASQLGRKIGKDDRARLDQYLTSVRELEQRMHAAGEWETRPRPSVEQEAPGDVTDRSLFFEKFEQMLKIATLALETDSTRIVTLMVDAFATPVFELDDEQKSSTSYHPLSHHGMRPEHLAQLELADRRQMVLLRRLMQDLAERSDGSGRMLDSTMILYGSNMGNANTHTNTNLPVLLAGGDLRHGQHVQFNQNRNTPLCNLFVTMLQQMGVEVDTFASSTGTLNEIQKKG